jgi:hypothetical protein
MDLRKYRRAVQTAIQARAQAMCFLSEDWINSYSPTVQKVRNEFFKAKGYIGIFAYWYGSRPPGSERSITHLEFLWATERWDEEQAPPMVIFMPEKPSRASRELEKKALELIAEQAYDPAEHHRLLRDFHQEVKEFKNIWRLVTTFADRQELREKAIVKCLHWQGFSPLGAAQGRIHVADLSGTGRQVMDDEFGLLGREEHLDAVMRTLSRVALHPEVPAVGILVHGDEDSGQRVFLRQMLKLKRMRAGRPAACGRPPQEQYDLTVLMRWVAVTLGVLSRGQEVDSPAGIAALVHAGLRDQQLCLVLDQVHHMIGGLAAFQREFWHPFYQALKELRVKRPVAHRLIAVVVDYTNYARPPEDCLDYSATAGPGDYASLLMLPALGAFTANDLLQWFEALEVPDSVDGRRAELVRAALSGRVGRLDGTPLRVFERLRTVSLWQKGSES